MLNSTYTLTYHALKFLKVCRVKAIEIILSPISGYKTAICHPRGFVNAPRPIYQNIQYCSQFDIYSHFSST